MKKKKKFGPPYAEINSIHRDIFNIVKGQLQVINSIGLGYMPKKPTFCVQIVHLRIELQIISYKELCLGL